MNFDELQTLIVLAGCKNFTRTAEKMNVVQSTVSSRIRSLENQLGLQLFIRDKKGLELTETGSLFLEYAKQLSKIERVARQETLSFQVFADRLNFACVNWIYDRWISGIVHDFVSQNSNIALNITIEHGKAILEMLLNGVVDLAHTSYAMMNYGFECLPSFRSKVVLVCSPIFSSLKKTIYKSELPELPLIYSHLWENSISDISEAILSEHKVFKIRSNMLHLSKYFCLYGQGYCFLPLEMVAKELERGELIKVTTHDFEIKDIQTYFVYNKTISDSPALKLWLNLLENLPRF